MPDLYRLESGSAARKELVDGVVVKVRHLKGSVFVPSPTELEANKDRLTKVGTCPDSDPRAKNAELNTNKTNQATAKASIPENITSFGIPDALALIAGTADKGLLEKYQMQEAANNRVRRKVLQAIAARLVQLEDVANDEESNFVPASQQNK